jgi:hypothetical protein
MYGVVHIGQMDTQAADIPEFCISAALLCATGQRLNDAVAESDLAEVTIKGVPFVEFQIGCLAKLGISRFFIEIEALPGSLVAMADRVENQGLSIEFIRSPSELRGKIASQQLLFVITENIYADDRLLTEIISQKAAFILTVDGREENAIFERIDLNGFWTGIAMLSSQSIEAIAALPDEWSISSSLLRRALQDSVVHRPIRQEILVSGQLQKITTPGQAVALSKALFQLQSASAEGFVEKFLYAPISAALAPLLIGIQSARVILNAAAGFLLLATLGSAFAGQAVTAAAIALLSLLALQIRQLLVQDILTSRYDNWLAQIPNVILAASLLAILWNFSADRSQNVFIGSIFFALYFLCARDLRGQVVRLFLCSRAFITFLIFILAALNILVAGLSVVILLQLASLILSGRSQHFAIRG